ncbi:unnamed protein product [Heterosigma akashiwo]
MTATPVVVADQRAVYDVAVPAAAPAPPPPKGAGTPPARAAPPPARGSPGAGVFGVEDGSANPSMAVENFRRRGEAPQNPVAAVAASAGCLVVARENGALQKYALPHLSLESRHQGRARPVRLGLNCDSTQCAVVDSNGVFAIFDFEAKGEGKGGGGAGAGALLDFERKDCWDFQWAADNPGLVGKAQPRRANMGRGGGGRKEEGGVRFDGRCCWAVMYNPENPEADMVFEHETAPLREARELVRNAGLQEAQAYAAARPHPRLWRLVAEAALEALDLGAAERAFVRCGDYGGLQAVRRLQGLSDRMKQRAEVAVYFKRFDEAEAIYREIDRKDLAIELRTRLGDWFRVVQLVQSGGGDDRTLAGSWDRIGDYYADRLKWAKAAQYYGQAKNLRRVAECHYRLEDYRGLQKLIEAVPDGHPLLLDPGPSSSPWASTSAPRVLPEGGRAQDGPSTAASA